jgi:hypothetical protein
VSAEWPPVLGTDSIERYRTEAARLRKKARRDTIQYLLATVAKLVRASKQQTEERAMICRTWHGWTSKPHADGYEAYLRDELFPRLRSELVAHGYKGFHILRLDDGDEVEFMTMVWFDTLDSVRAFAGEAYDTPVISAKAAGLLAHYDGRCRHYALKGSGWIARG